MSDILAVPFSPEEFVARVLAVVRRTDGDAAVFTPVRRLEYTFVLTRRGTLSRGWSAEAEFHWE